MVQVIFNAVGRDNIRVGVIGEEVIEISKLPKQLVRDVTDLKGICVTAIDISHKGGKPLGDIRVYLNEEGQLMANTQQIDKEIELNQVRILRER